MQNNQQTQTAEEFSSEILMAVVEKFEWGDLDAQYKPEPVVKQVHALRIIVPQILKYTQHRFFLLLETNQLSDRAFALTTILLNDDSSNYYALMYRKNIFVALNKNPSQQLKFVTYLLQNDPKCYQMWTYRRFLAQTLQFQGEYEAIDGFLKEDMNNYHVWSYRIWVTQTSKNYDKEWLASNKMRENNFRMLECNSYWSYRMFLLSKRMINGNNEEIENQIKTSLEILKQKDTNECVWNYLNGFFNETWTDKITKKPLKYSDYKEIEKICEDKSNRFKMNTLVLIYKENGKTQEWRNILLQLIQTDLTRKQYYQYVLKTQQQ